MAFLHFIVFVAVLQWFGHHAEATTERADRTCTATITVKNPWDGFFDSDVIIPTSIYKLMKSTNQINPALHCPTEMEAQSLSSDEMNIFPTDTQNKILGRCLVLPMLNQTQHGEFLQYFAGCACDNLPCWLACGKNPCPVTGKTVTMNDTNRIPVDCLCLAEDPVPAGMIPEMVRE